MNQKDEHELANSKVTLLRQQVETARLTCVSFVVTYGILTLFSYCFFSARFIPSGVTPGDTLLFVFIALAVGVVGFFLSVFGGLFWLPFFLDDQRSESEPVDLEKLRKRRKWLVWAGLFYLVAIAFSAVLLWSDFLPKEKRLPCLSSDLTRWHLLALLALVDVAGVAVLFVRNIVGVAAICLSALPALAVLAGALVAVFPQGDVVLLGCFVGGLLLAFAVGRPTDFRPLFIASSGGKAEQVHQKSGHPLTPYQRLISGVGGVVASFLMISIYGANESKVGVASLVFGQLGLFSQDAAMVVSAENLQTLQGAADLDQINLQVCRGPEGTATVTGLKVWWHGIGTRSLVELRRAGDAENPKKGVRVELLTSGAKLIRDYDTRCIEVPDVAFFKSGEGKLMSDDGREELKRALKGALMGGNPERKLVAIEVVGHADPMPPEGGVTNEQLAKDRAMEVERVMKSIEGLQEYWARKNDAASAAVTVRSYGARRPIQACKPEGSIAAQRECNSVNRRVEVRLRFGPATSPAGSASGASA